MPLSVTCSCGQKLKAPENLAGKAVKCPKCKQPLKIPAAAPAPEIDLSSSSSLSSGLDDLFSQELGSPGMSQPAGFNSPAQFGRTLPPVASRGSDGFPKWMLWAGGGITLVLLLGLGIAMLVTSLAAGSKPEPIVQGEVAVNADGTPLAPDEVREADVAAAFQEQKRATNSEPVAKFPDRADNEKALEPATDEGRSADELASESGVAAAETDEPLAEELDEALLATLRDRIKNETPGKLPPLHIDRRVDSGIRQVMDGLGEAYRRGVQSAFEPIVDEERFADTVEKIALQSGVQASTISEFKKGMKGRTIISSGLLKNRDVLAFDQYEIRHVELSPNRKTAAIIVRTLTLNGDSSLKFRFWLCKHGSAWKFYDFENLATALRTSTMVSMMVGTNQEVLAILPEVTALAEVIAVYRTGDPQQLTTALDRLDALAKKKPSHFIRHYYRSMLYFSENKYEQMLGEAETAHAISPQSPELFILRAFANNHLEDYPAAIALANAYAKRLGPDELYWLAIGGSLEGMEYPEDAIACWCRGLEYNPNHDILLYNLAVSYPMDELQKMKPYVQRSKLQQQAFENLLVSLEEDNRTDIRDLLIELREQDE
jgi:hypothetical protein